MKKYCIFLFCAVNLSNYAFAQLDAVPFPSTHADLPFQVRIQNATEGYKPFMDKRAYTELNIAPDEEIYTDSMIAQIEFNETKNDTTIDNPTEKSDRLPISTLNYTNIGGGNVIENNTIVGGACYPADTDRHFVNKILTTGKYEHISPAFEKALITIFRKEGTCGTIPGDPCGYTCYGIGSNPKCGGVIVSSRSEAEDWYYQHFWKKYDIYKLPDVISTDFLLAAMASGPKTAYEQFCKFLGVSTSKTYNINDEIIHAVNNYKGDIHNNWIDKRDTFLQEVAKKRYNGTVSAGYKNAIELKRKNGCHVRPEKPLYRG